MARPPTVAVVLNYNAGESLATCVAALARARDEGAVAELLVLDNGSHDGSFDPDAIRRAGGQPLALGSNLGFAAAHNVALRRLADRNVLLVNPDAVVVPSGIRAMRAVLEEEPAVAAVGGALQLPDGTFQPSAFPEPSLGWALAHLLNLKASTGLRRLAGAVPALGRTARPYVAAHAGEARDVDWVVGACLLLRSEALADVGGFDERFFLYFEEIDWC
ncbi:MAG: glycosyltransferase family 2 protein, partial [Actinomycetota bacterium]|nr:glycosyltransferase family 2 protein [Actinomycetota bacterium]